MEKALRFLIVLVVIGAMVAAFGFVAMRFARPAQGTAAGGAPAAGSGSAEAQLVAMYLAFRGGEINGAAGVDDRAVNFVVRAGDTTTVIGQRLQQAGLIRDAELFRLYVRSRGADGRLEAGEYSLRATMTLAQIAQQLEHARAASFTLTLREGLRLEEVAEVVSATTRISGAAFLNEVKTGRYTYAFLADRPAGVGLEGYLFPDTYEIAATATPSQVVSLLLSTFDQRFTLAMRQQAAARQRTVFQVVTIASLVEREAQVASERPIIASVYLNRLSQSMALEADSTVQYALGYDAKAKTWWRTLALDDLRKPVGSYSTYLNRGLPPGPICSPGLASIQAVLAPATTDYLYYYAKGDGSHAFARTFEEHQDNMRKYGR